MSIISNLTQAFDPEGLLSVVADNPDSLRSNAKTTTFAQGRRAPFQATIGGQTFSAYATLKSASLHRISVIDHYSTKNDSTSKLVTGIFKPVHMDIEIVVGDEILTLQEVLRQITNAQAKTPVSEEQFAATLEALGLKFMSGMNLFWQQFGARQDGIDHLVENFIKAGAVDVYGKIKNPGRIKESYQMPEVNGVDLAGPSVVSFDLGRADRNESQTGQGFLDLVDAVTDNFKRIVKLRKAADIMKADTNAKSVAEGWSSERIKAANDQATQLVRLSQQWASTWSGAQQRIMIDEKDPSVKTPQDVYDPTSAPCGRFKMIVNDETVEIDLWSNSARANTSSGATASSAKVETPAGEPTPITWE